MKKHLVTIAAALCLTILSPMIVPFATAHANPAWNQVSLEKQFELIDKMDLDGEDVISFYYTSMEGSPDGRIHNIKKAVNRIDDKELEPQELFSFNDEVGNSNIAEDGWEKANVIVGGQLVEGYGGGICQVSSTLFNAAQGAGLTVVERHTHSKQVGYVPVGQDATVAYGWLDLKISNPYPFPVTIEAKTFDNQYVAIALVRAD